MTKRTLVLAGFLALMWLLLSGHIQPLLLSLGAASVMLVVLIAGRMDVVDREGHPYHLRASRVLQYWGWLLVEIIQSNLDVARRIVLGAHAPISPTRFRVSATQQTELGQVIYANSITLTPGTVSIDLADGMIEVHALTRDAATALRGGEMDRRVTALEETQ